MKKLWILLIGIMMGIGFVSCGGESNVPDYEDFESQLSMPVNLVVNDLTKTVSWEAVEGASGYDVYVNGEKEDEVGETTFDFSGISGDVLLFNVVALGPKGVADSQMSASIAYVDNRSAVIDSMILELGQSDMEFWDEEAFATELVNKGMSPSEFETMMSDVQSLDQVMYMDDFSDMFDSIDEVIASMDMNDIEAFVSALLKVELPASIQEQIDWYSTYYGEDSYEVAQQQAYLDFLNENGDEAVQSVMVVVEYIINVENTIDETMISDMESMMGSFGTSQFDAATFVSLKDDMIQNLIDELPSIDDMILVNSTLYTLGNMLSDDELESLDILSVPKMSAQMLLSAELFFNFLLTFDEDFVEAAIDLASIPTLSSNQRVLAKETIDLLRDFFSEQEDLMDDIDQIYTDEEKEDMFVSVLLLIESTMYNMLAILSGDNEDYTDEIEYIIRENINFSDVLVLQEAMGDGFVDFLDAIADSDYAIVDSLFDLVDYSTRTSNYDGYSDLVLDVVDDALDLLNPFVQDMEKETFDAAVSLIGGMVMTQYDIASLFEAGGMTTLSSMIIYFEDAILAADTDAIAVIQAVFDIATKETYIEDIVGFYQSIYTDDNATYGAVIEFANAMIDLDAEVGSEIDAIIDEFATTLENPDVMAELELTSSEVADIIANVEGYVNDVIVYANQIKDYDYQNLTGDQMEDIEFFIDVINGEYFGS